MEAADGMTSPNNDASSEQADGQIGDGLDDEAWRHVAAILATAHEGNADAMARQLQSYEAAMSDDQRSAAGAYVGYILRWQVIEPLDHRPTLRDLMELAKRIYPRYARVIRRPVLTLEDTLRAVFMMPRPASQLTGARLFISAAAAAGVLLRDPVRDLAAMRPRVARWRARDADVG